MAATDATNATNGRPPKKQLSDQLDRLDGVIDGLCDGLPRVVAEATREGARQAVQDVILELLGNPEVRGLIAGMAPPPSAEPAAPRPTVWTRARARLLAAKSAVVSRCRAATAAVAGTARTLALVLLKKILLVGAGVAAGVVSHLRPHGLSAVVNGVGGACAAVAAQVGRWARRSAAAFGLVGTS